MEEGVGGSFKTPKKGWLLKDDHSKFEKKKSSPVLHSPMYFSPSTIHAKMVDQVDVKSNIVKS